jgi:hypothetical protein
VIGIIAMRMAELARFNEEQKDAMKIIPKASPLNVFIGGPIPISPGFPLKACGNDGLQTGNWFDAASCAELDHRD